MSGRPRGYDFFEMLLRFVRREPADFATLASPPGVSPASTTCLSGIALPTELPRTSLQICLTPKTCLSSPGIQWKFTEVNPRTCEPLAAISASATCSKGAFNRVATRFGDGSARRRKNRRPSLVQSLRSPGNRPVQSPERRHRENCSHPHRLRRRRCGGRAFNHQAQAAH
jgi:hypothetical protein